MCRFFGESECIPIWTISMKVYVFLLSVIIFAAPGCTNHIEVWKQHYRPASYVVKSAPAVQPDIVRGEEFSSPSGPSEVIKRSRNSVVGGRGNLYLGDMVFSVKVLTPGHLRWITASMGGDYYYCNTVVRKDFVKPVYELFIFATPARQGELTRLGVLELRRAPKIDKSNPPASALLLNESTL